MNADKITRIDLTMTVAEALVLHGVLRVAIDKIGIDDPGYSFVQDLKATLSGALNDG